MEAKRRKGILFILLAAVFFSGTSVCVRLAGDLPVIQKAFYGNLVIVIASWVVFIPSNEKTKLTKRNFLDIMMRSIFGLSGFLLNLYAIDKMNLADATLLNKLAPFFTMITSIFILKEKPSKKEWGFLILAFIGAMLVIKPGFNMEILPAILGTLSGFGAGIAYTFVRKLGNEGMTNKSIVTYFATISMIVYIPFILTNHQSMTTMQLIYLLASGLCTTGGQYAITAAYMYAPARELASYDYSQIVFTAMIAFFLFGELPDIFSVLGYIIIIGVGVLRVRNSKA